MTNALFNDNRLKLGVFGLNVSNGCAARPLPKATWSPPGKTTWTFNVVCGWYEPEFLMFGAPVMEHDTLYDYAT